MTNYDAKTIKKALQRKESEELLAIWEANNKEDWREEAFSAIYEILTERGVDIPEQKPFEVPEEEPTVISFLGDEMCLGCGAIIPKTLQSCPDCGTPTSRATLDPIGAILAQGHVYREATKPDTRKMVLLGMWLFFAPQILLIIIQSIWLINDWINPSLTLDFETGKLVPCNDYSIDFFLFILLGLAVLSLYCFILYKATVRFRKARIYE